MYKGILCAWIIGIALMGIDLPISKMQIWSIYIISLIAIGVVYFTIKNTAYRNIIMTVCALPLSCLVAYQYADNQLNQRLSYQELHNKQATIIVYVDKINQLTDSAILQKAEVLSGFSVQKKDFSQPIYWLLRTPLQQVKHNPLVMDYSDSQDENVSSANVDNSQNLSENFPKKSKKADKPKLETLQLGQYYRLTGQIRPNHGYANQGSFDSEKWLLQQNIMAGFKITQIEPLSHEDIAKLGFTKHLQQHQSWWQRSQLAIEKIRLNFREFIIKQPLDNKGLILALLTGDRSLLNDDIEQQFQTLGISHLLAISGPHVLILALMMTWLLNQLLIKFRVKTYLQIARPYVLCLPFICTVLFYTAFVGFEIPALRTLLMSSVITILLLANRQLHAMTILLISASILLLYNPFSILSASFWLSFGASLILLRVYQTINQDVMPMTEQELANLSHMDKAKMAISALITSQWKIFIALFPMVMIFFQKVSWLSPIINIIAIPILGLIIVPLNIIAGVVYFIYKDLAYVVWWVVDIGLNILLAILNGLQKIFSIELVAIALQPMMIVVIIIAIILFFLPKSVLPKSWIVVCCIALGLMKWYHQPKFELQVLDVGQGQSIFIRTESQKMLIDTGGYYDEERFSIGQNVVVPFLLRQGVNQLDQVILSHLDNDHSGALPYIVRDIGVKTILSNENLQGSDYLSIVQAEAKQSRPIHTELCMANQNMQLSKYAVARFYSPFADTPQSEIRKNRNEYSCVVLIQVFDKAGKYQNFLIMGDAGHDTEYMLMEKFPNLKVDVLILGHHGSKHSTSEEFLDFYKPKLAIASAGYANRYRHPHSEVVELLKSRNIPLLTTIEQGTIRFKMQEDGTIQLDQYRDQYQWLKNNRQ